MCDSPSTPTNPVTNALEFWRSFDLVDPALMDAVSVKEKREWTTNVPWDENTFSETTAVYFGFGPRALD